MSRSRRLRWAVPVAILLLIVVTGAIVLTSTRSGPAPLASLDVTIDVVDGPAHDQHVRLDATVYLPQRTPAPAVIISPGFGGDKGTVAGQAKDLAARGFVVLAYTPRGFGHSTGKIALNSPDYEVADARQLVDWLARRPDVIKDGPGDPRVGVTGVSYGGALSLMLAGSDPRVDAIAPAITYNDLSQSLLPDAATTQPLPHTPAAGAFGDNGVFKRTWAGYFFASGLRGGSGADPTCGRFIAAVCRAYQQVATAGTASKATVDLLRRDSPMTVTGNIKVPTLLIQGEHDTLFGLDQADANARQIHRAGGKVKVIWYTGGHDAGNPGARLQQEIGDWFDFHLAHHGSDPGTAFSYQVQGAIRSNGKNTVRTVTAPDYPGLAGGRTERKQLALSGKPQPVLNPAGGNPQALSSLPGISGGLGSLSSRLAADIPGEFAHFTTPALRSQLLIAGTSLVRLRVKATPGAVLFAKLYVVGPDGTKTLPGSAVAPFRVPAGSSEVTVTLPGVVAPVRAGSHLEFVVSSTDQAYTNATKPAVYQVAVDGGLSVPLVPGRSSSATAFPLGQLIGIGVVLLLCVCGGLLLALRRRHRDDVDSELTDVPLVLDNLSKTYRGKLQVVDSLSFRVERGQVLGLLGPNGAGKTTALRMLLG
ncbi:MAG: alpha/beta fold hydrolase, partial [Sciscionella sp.]